MNLWLTHRKPWLVLVAFAVAAITLIFSLAGQHVTPSKADPCGPNWSQSQDSNLIEDCAKEKATISVQEDGQAVATAQAQSYDGGTTTNQPYELTPNAADTSIYQVDVEETAGGPPTLRGANTEWRIGKVPNGDGNALNSLYVYSKPANYTDVNADPTETPLPLANATSQYTYGILGTYVFNADQYDIDKYVHTWTCPQPIGTLSITGVSGPLGVVSFTSEAGVTGTLDMSTGNWSLSTNH